MSFRTEVGKADGQSTPNGNCHSRHVSSCSRDPTWAVGRDFSWLSQSGKTNLLTLEACCPLHGKVMDQFLTQDQQGGQGRKGRSHLICKSLACLSLPISTKCHAGCSCKCPKSYCGQDPMERTLLTVHLIASSIHTFSASCRLSCWIHATSRECGNLSWHTLLQSLLQSGGSTLSGKNYGIWGSSTSLKRHINIDELVGHKYTHAIVTIDCAWHW